jgi:hypothetical protein
VILVAHSQEWCQPTGITCAKSINPYGGCGPQRLPKLGSAALNPETEYGAHQVRNCLQRSGRGQPPDHEATHRGRHQRCTGLACAFVVLAPPAGLPEPGEGPFHRPPAGQAREGRARRRFDRPGDRHPPRGRLHGLGGPLRWLLGLRLALASALIACIPPPAGLSGAQRLPLLRGPWERDTGTIQDIRWMHGCGEGEALGSREQRPLPPLDPFSAAIASLTSHSRGLHALTVNAAGAWLRSPAPGQAGVLA